MKPRFLHQFGDDEVSTWARRIPGGGSLRLCLVQPFQSVKSSKTLTTAGTLVKMKRLVCPAETYLAITARPTFYLPEISCQLRIDNA